MICTNVCQHTICTMSLLRACGKFPTMHTYIPVDHWLPSYTAASRTLFDNMATNVCAYQKFCKLTIAVFGIPDWKRIMYRDSLSYDCVKFLAWVIAWMTMHNLPRSHLVHSLLVPYLQTQNSIQFLYPPATTSQPSVGLFPSPIPCSTLSPPSNFNIVHTL